MLYNRIKARKKSNASLGEDVQMRAAKNLAAHLDVGTIVTGVVGFSMVFMVNTGTQKLDKLTDQISQLNEKMAAVLARNEWQAKKDEEQDAKAAKQWEHILAIETQLAKLEHR